MENIANVSINPLANIYFDGKCVSHGIVTADGAKKTVGVIFPASLTFNTGAPEIMEIVAGSCRYRLPGGEWQVVNGGSSFNVPGNTSFDIEVTDTLHYVCHFE